MPNSIKKIFIVFISAVLAAMSGCSTIAEKTNILSDEKVLSLSAGAIGYQIDQLTLVNRRTEGTNTYVLVKTDDGKEYNCIVNGGNIMTAGMTNPPMCARKGEQMNSSPFRR